MRGYDLISKGTYPRSEADDFVSIVQYLFIRRDGRKLLLLKVSNDRDETLTGVKLSVRQTDAKGADLGGFTAEAKVNKGAPHTQAVLSEEIVLDDGCVGFSVEVVAAYFGPYTCSLREKRVIVSYEGERKLERRKSPDDYLSKTGGKKLSVSGRSIKAAVVGLAAALTLLFAFGLTLLQLNFFKKDATSFLIDGIEYSYQYVNGNSVANSPVSVVGYRRRPKRLVIPEKIEDHPVTKIESHAFYYCESLEYVDLGSVTEIGAQAFSQCTRLREVRARNLETIDYGAFSFNESLTFVDISNSEKALKIGSEAFGSCGNLETVNIDQFIDYKGENIFNGSTYIKNLNLKNFNHFPYGYAPLGRIDQLFGGGRIQISSLRIDYIDEIPENFCINGTLSSIEFVNLSSSRIGNGAFQGNSLLERVDFPNEITYIGDYAFANTALTEFDGRFLEYLGNGAFLGCSQLKNVFLEENVRLESLGDERTFQQSGLESIYIPSQIEYLGYNLFSGCQNLETVTFSPSSQLKSIGMETFASCVNLSSISFPESLESLDTGAFKQCSKLEGVEIPQKLAYIGDYAFASCRGLREMKIPETVLWIGFGAFGSCRNLESLSLPYIGSSASSNNYLSYIFGGKTVNSLGFVPESLATVTLTSGRTVPDYAFYGCTGLKRVNLPDETESLGSYAFSGCISLENAPIGNEVSSIGASAFENCKSLTFVLLPDGVTKIGQGAFYGCDALAELSLPFVGGSRISDRYFSYIFGSSENMDSYNVPKSVKKVTLTSETAIPQKAFYNCDALREVVLNEGVGSVGKSAFTWCRRLNKINIPSSVKEISDNAFTSCFTLFEICNFSVLEISRGSLANGGIGAYALNVYDKGGSPMPRAEQDGCSFAKASDGWYLVDCGEKETLLLLPASFYGDGGYVGRYEIPPYLFMSNYQIERVEISAGVQRIGDYAFQNCGMLTAAVFAADSPITEIGEGTFLGCANLRTAELPAALERIETQAFSNCAALESITLHEKVSDIGQDAFSGCHSLSEVYNYSGLSITAGSVEHGKVAFYALAVYNSAGERLREVTVNGLSFKTYGDKWWLVGYATPPANLTLDAFEYEGKTVSAYSVRKGAFQSCYDLMRVSIGGAVTEIGENAFSDCVNLKEFVFENTSAITRIESGTFGGCSALERIDLPKELEAIGSGAFAYCTALRSLTVPQTVRSIDGDAFFECRYLHQIYNFSRLPLNCGSSQYGYVACYAIKISYSATDPAVEYAEKDGFKFVACDGRGYLYKSESAGASQRLALPKSFEAGGKTISSYVLKNGAFSNGYFVSVFIPLSVTRIEDDAFVNCSNFSRIYYEGTLTEWRTLRIGNSSNAPHLSCPIEYSAK